MKGRGDLVSIRGQWFYKNRFLLEWPHARLCLWDVYSLVWIFGRRLCFSSHFHHLLRAEWEQQRWQNRNGLERKERKEARVVNLFWIIATFPLFFLRSDDISKISAPLVHFSCPCLLVFSELGPLMPLSFMLHLNHLSLFSQRQGMSVQQCGHDLLCRLELTTFLERLCWPSLWLDAPRHKFECQFCLLGEVLFYPVLIMISWVPWFPCRSVSQP